MTITLYLINKKGYEVLKYLCSKSEKTLIERVVASKDQGNSADYFEEIKQLCLINSIPFYTRKDQFVNKSNYSIAIGWRWLIKGVQNLIVFHDSYLPQYRGFAPIVNMLINGEKYLAASAIFASDKMDEGDIIIRKKIPIKYPIKISEAIDLVSEMYKNLAHFILEKLVMEERLPAEPQESKNATYSIWRDEQDYFINWKESALRIKRMVDAVGYPYGGARTRTIEGEVFKILECTVIDNIKAEIPGPGKVLYNHDAPVILCGEGALMLEKMESLNGIPFKFKKFRTRLL
jgi:methionyl-tRNA formyltransferase